MLVAATDFWKLPTVLPSCLYLCVSLHVDSINVYRDARVLKQGRLACGFVTLASSILPGALLKTRSSSGAVARLGRLVKLCQVFVLDVLHFLASAIFLVSLVLPCRYIRKTHISFVVVHRHTYMHTYINANMPAYKHSRRRSNICTYMSCPSANMSLSFALSAPLPLSDTSQMCWVGG